MNPKDFRFLSNNDVENTIKVKHFYPNPVLNKINTVGTNEKAQIKYKSKE